MNKITFPLKPNMRRDTVADLQDGLLLLLETNRALFAPPPPTPPFTHDPKPIDWTKVIKLLQEEREKKHYGKVTRSLIQNFQKANNLEASGSVDEPTAKALNRLLDELKEPVEPAMYSVKGTVLLADGSPLDNVVIRAFDIDFRSEQLLGETRPRGGQYEITYRQQDFARAEKLSADLMVRAYSGRSRKAVIESPTYFNVPREAIIDLVADTDRVPVASEYERLMSILAPLVGEVSPADFGDDDIKFLAGETRFSPRFLAFLAIGHRHGRDSRVPAPVFYGMYRQGLPTNLAALLLNPSRLHRQALERALEGRIIPASLEDKLDQILQAIDTLRTDYLLTHDTDHDLPLPGLIDVSGIPTRSKKKFLNRYYQHEGDAKAFWQKLVEERALPVKQIEDLRFTLQLALITDNNVPLVKLVAAEANTISDFATLTIKDWRKAIEQAGNATIPKTIPGKTARERVNNYAGRIFQVLQAAIPTAFVRQGIASDTRWTDALHTDLLRFFNNAPRFDFRKGPLNRYLEQENDKLSGVADKQATRNELNRLQRVFRIAPVYTQMRVLLEKGLDSAAAVVDIPYNNFLQELGEALGGFDQAQLIYAKSQQTSAATASTYTWFQQSIKNYTPSAIGQAESASLAQNPDWEELFGSIDFCECRHCRSVYSPAAYLVDQLQFLSNSGPAYTELMNRRPDLKYIKLSCENTNTLIPTIDLADEILQFYVLYGAFADIEREKKAQELAGDTGEATAEELSINPQYTDHDADDVLRQAVFSLALPYNPPLATARSYLAQLGTSRHELMSLFQNDSDPANNLPADLDIAVEYLGFSVEEYRIIVADLANLPREYFGYPADNVKHINPDDTIVQENWQANLARVPEFMRRTGLAYEDLLALLKTRFVNPAQSEPFPPATVVLFSPEGVCDLSRTWIQYLSSDHQNLGTTGLNDLAWVKLHRFLRLWHKLGWSMRELDQTMIALGAADIDPPLVESLAHIARLQAELAQPIEDLLAFWGPVITAEPASVYDRLFQNKRVIWPLDSAFALNASRSDLANTSALLADHATTLQAALRINANELSLLLDATGLSGVGATLNLANLSLLYRHMVLARSLKLKVGELGALLIMIGENPFTSPEATVAFVGRVRLVSESQFDVSQLDYLYRHQYEPGQRPAPAEEEVLILLKALAKGLSDILDQTRATPDPSQDQLAAKLAVVLEPDIAEQALAIIERRSSLPDSEQEQFIDNHFAVFLDGVEARNELLGPSVMDPDERVLANRNYVWPKLLEHIRQIESASLVKQNLSTALPLEAELLQLLIEKILPARSDPSLKAIDDFVSLSNVANPEERVPDYVRLHKLAILITGFAIRADELRYLDEHGNDFGGFDLSGMPLDRDNPAATDNDAATLFEQWERLNRLFGLRDHLPEGDLKLLDVLGAASDVQARALLAQLTGWQAEEMALLSGPQGLAFPDAAFKDGSAVNRLLGIFTLGRRTGVAVSQLNQWARQTTDAEQAQAVVHAAKARYDDEQWRDVASMLNDRLREQRTRALIAHVLADVRIVDEGIQDANGLFEYFLIDVAMAPCMKTSRIKQAGLSIQLFVQRCLLDQEQHVPATAIDTDRWSWMKNYRVWEANRKVFLYPENWIEPELRDDKSPFFKELENQLLQNELTEEHVERALMSYLEKVDDVGSLEAVGLYRQREGFAANRTDTVHVVARSFNTPKHYFYRSYDVIRERWTAWESVSVGIEGDHVIPVVWNRRLHLFWPIFTEKPDMDMTRDYLPDGIEPLTRWEIGMAWSERRQSGWTPKQVSASVIVSPMKRESKNFVGVETWFYLPKHEEHYFRVYAQDNFLKITCSRRYQQQLAKLSVYTLIGTSFTVITDSSKLESRNLTSTDHKVVGSFQFTGCRGQAKVDDDDYDQTFDSLGEPEDTDNQAMGFASESTASALTLQDDEHNEILRGIDGPFHFLAAPTVRDLGDTFYPFFYQDPKRVYFAMPVSDDPFRVTKALHTPQFSMRMETHDALISNTPLLDLAGPGISDPVPVAASSLLQQLDTKPSSAHGSFPVSVPLGPGQRVLSFGGDSADLFALSGSLLSSDIKIRSSDKPSEIGVISPDDDAANFTGWENFARWNAELKFHSFFHPHVCAFIKALNKAGVPGLLTLKNQRIGNDPANDTLFHITYRPSWKVHPTYPREDVDFRPNGAYSVYNWELFFHAPLLIADRLSKEQRFEAAQRWFHYLFNLTSSSNDPVPARYWNVLPFHEQDESGRIEDYLRLLHDGTNAQKKELIRQIDEWRDNPFNPHLIARTRMAAYKKTVVMKYLDNLINWGDQLFSRDSMESINEAAQLYILAFTILGRRPEQIARRTRPKYKNYAELADELGAFSNALVEMENVFPFTDEESITQSQQGGAESLGTVPLLYFCIPTNDKLLAYWDKVEDRLFKIRHCMNIEGVVRQLPLFEPPIDPALLVRATAAGLDLGSVLAELNAPLPHYRFQFMLQKAIQLCDEVKSLGGALLSALEKKDAEALAALRVNHEVQALRAARDVRNEQVNQANAEYTALEQTRKVVEKRHEFYTGNLKGKLIDGERTQLNEGELTQQSELGESQSKQSDAAENEFFAQLANIIPSFSFGTAGVSGSPLSTVSFGGSNFAASLQALARNLSGEASAHSHTANMSAIKAGQARRSDDWAFQRDLANRELDQIDKQLLSAEIRIAIAKVELSNHDLQIENAESVQTFFDSKYTNEELYQWQLGQISGVYFQSYKLAYDLAKRAERCFRFELGLPDSNYINFGYWDSLRKGLLSGEKLQHDLRRLDTAYLEHDRREFELTKHVSLTLLDPLALVKLRETGRCLIHLPEEIFDLDYPGHYFRRIKSVSLTLPCVVGPYTTVSCTLRLLKNSIRINTANGDNGYPRNMDQGLPADDNRFIENNIPVKAVAASSAQNDSGVFELNFRDERYLPFEGAGAISEWSLELFSDDDSDYGKPLRQFDYNTISDAILHIKYTAREDAGPFKNGSIAHLRDYFRQDGGTNSLRMFNLKQEFPTQWHRFLHPSDPTEGNVFALEMVPSLFPILSQGKTLKVNMIWLLARCAATESYDVVMTVPLPPPVKSDTMTLAPPGNQYGGLHSSQNDVSGLGIEIVPEDTPITWQLKMTRPGGGNLQEHPVTNAMEVEDFLLVLGYEWE